MIPYKFLSTTGNHDTYWDQTLIKDILEDYRFTNQQGDGAIVILPGESEAENYKKVNLELSSLKWVLLIITSDERSTFPVEKIKHPNIKIYIQYPKRDRHDKYTKWPIGYAKETRQHLELVDKDLIYFLSAQNTHKRRKQCFRQLSKVEGGLAKKTKGFTQGLSPKEYMGYMNRAKVAPCPAGPVCADSFRTYEALEAGALPIADSISEAGDYDYLEYLFNSVPFPTISKYKNLPGYIEDCLVNFQPKANRIQAWWIKKKRDLKMQIISDVSELSGEDYRSPITVVVPVSPIKSHPSTEILEKCINTIRHHRDSEIIITFDGVSEHHETRREDYEEFIRRALFFCNTKWNAIPLIFDEHTHQVGMLKKTLEIIDTPTILYVEGDTGLVMDKPISFNYCLDKILDGTSNLIRFHYEGVLPHEHEYMMLDRDRDLIETSQWSQRPHLASTAYYRRVLRDYFSENARSFIEDKMHSVVYEDYKINGRPGWYQHRIHIYFADEDLKYSVDFDGRQGEKKWDEEQVF